jgi:hypothetical protein
MRAPARPAILRLLRPSLTDVVFAGILLWSFIAADGGWGRLLQDADTGLHIRIGDYILQTGHVPTTDPFSFTKNGGEWYAWEWLSGVVFSTLNTHYGLKGVVFVCGAAIMATLLIVLRTCLLNGANALLAVILILCAANAGSLHFLARPHVFTWLFLSIVLWILTKDALEPSARVWSLVPLTALWVNLHAGFPVVFGLLGCAMAGAVSDRPRLLRYLKVAGACGVACLLNPYGYKLPLHTGAYLLNTSIRNTIAELQAPTFRSEAHLYFMLLLFAGLAVSGFLLASRRYGEALLIFGLAAMALTSVRHVPIYALCVVPIVGRELSVKWNAFVEKQPRTSVVGAVQDMTESMRVKMRPAVLWPVALLAVLFFVPGAIHWPKNFDAKDFPVAIQSRHGTELAGTRLYTTDQWADFLMFRNPAQRVFMDDRDFYGDRIVNDALKLMEGAPGWRGLLSSYRINAVLCPPGASLGSLLAEDNGWRLEDQDATALLFRKLE